MTSNNGNEVRKRGHGTAMAKQTKGGSQNRDSVAGNKHLKVVSKEVRL